MQTLIVRYFGDLSFVKTEYEGEVIELLGGYAIISISSFYVDQLRNREEIIYIEEPSPLFLQVNEAKRANCISSTSLGPVVQDNQTSNLSGKGTIVAIIDSGIDYLHPDFINEDGTTRILSIWDQTGAAREGEISPYGIGVEYDADRINEAISKRRTEALTIVPEVDTSGHGTFVAGVAAGNGRASNGRYQGVAYESNLLIVKLRSSRGSGYPGTVELMLAMDYIFRYGTKSGLPIAINLSYGNSYGTHTGQTLVETYINQLLPSIRGNLCVGMGNEGDTGKHARINLKTGETKSISFSIASNQQPFRLQMIKHPEDILDVHLTSPDGLRYSIINKNDTQIIQWENTKITIRFISSKPYQLLEEWQMLFEPEINQQSQWSLEFYGSDIKVGEIHAYLPVSQVALFGTRFLEEDVNGTLTIPATAVSAISVGAYDSSQDRFASFSGRGFSNQGNQFVDYKPDLVAPGVAITSCAPGGGYTVKSGTSVATPFVTGCVALLLQWGIVNENDPFLYGEKIRAALRKGARRLPGFSIPSNAIGFGALCFRESQASRTQ